MAEERRPRRANRTKKEIAEAEVAAEEKRLTRARARLVTARDAMNRVREEITAHESRLEYLRANPDLGGPEQQKGTPVVEG